MQQNLYNAHYVKEKGAISTAQEGVIILIFIILGIAIALACYRMGIIIGRWSMLEEFNKIRSEMELDNVQDEWDELFKGSDKHEQ